MNALDQDHGGVAPALELDDAESVTVWLCTKTGQAMHVSSDSEEEHDYRECACGAPLKKRLYELAEWPYADDPPDPL
jgi:hypothetical protein